MAIWEENMSIKLSVITPIYNGAAYLEAFFKNILTQTFTDFELILVDDGSTDNSKDIINEYKNRIDIKVLSASHSGVGMARRLAMQVATGDYVTFVDVDDYFTEFHFEKYLETIVMQKSDLVFNKVNVQKKIHKWVQPLPYDGWVDSNVVIEGMLDGKINGWLFQTISKRDFWKQESFVENVNFAEDLVALVLNLQSRHNKKIWFSNKNEPTYIYEQNPKSITNSFNPEMARQLILSMESIANGEATVATNIDFSKFILRQLLYVYRKSIILKHKESISILRNYMLSNSSWLNIPFVMRFKIRFGLFGLRARFFSNNKE